MIAENALFLWKFNTRRCLTLSKNFKATFYWSFTKIISCDIEQKVALKVFNLMNVKSWTKKIKNTDLMYSIITKRISINHPEINFILPKFLPKFLHRCSTWPLAVDSFWYLLSHTSPKACCTSNDLKWYIRELVLTQVHWYLGCHL